MTTFRRIERRSKFGRTVRSALVTAHPPVGERPGGSDSICIVCGYHVCSCNRRFGEPSKPLSLTPIGSSRLSRTVVVPCKACNAPIDISAEFVAPCRIVLEGRAWCAACAVSQPSHEAGKPLVTHYGFDFNPHSFFIPFTFGAGFGGDTVFNATRIPISSRITLGKSSHGAHVPRAGGTITGNYVARATSCAHGVNGACSACQPFTVTYSRVADAALYASGSVTSTPNQLEPDALPGGWLAMSTIHGDYGHADGRVALQTDGSYSAYRRRESIWTHDHATRAEAMCAALSYGVTRIKEGINPFFWRRPDGEPDPSCDWFATAELAALAALAFDHAQRTRGE